MPEQGWTVRLLQFKVDDEEFDPIIREERHIHIEELDTQVMKMVRLVEDDTTYVMVLRDERGD